MNPFPKSLRAPYNCLGILRHLPCGAPANKQGIHLRRQLERFLPILGYKGYGPSEFRDPMRVISISIQGCQSIPDHIRGNHKQTRILIWPHLL
jgi:hypothetical protein